MSEQKQGVSDPGAPDPNALITHVFIVVDPSCESYYKDLIETQTRICTMTAKKPTVFFVVDIETTLKHRVAFDIAWKAIDRKGREYGKGSYVIREAFKLDVPFFKEKLGFYFDDAYAKLIQPASIIEVQKEFNTQVSTLQQEGHRTIGCAYNSAFDFKYLPETLQKITGNSGAQWLTQPMELMDIWDFWGESVPKEYVKIAMASASGKYVSTSAESAYRFEFMLPDFEERHIAWHDVQIESEILLKALARRKKMPIVNSPKDFTGAVWKKINTRLGVDGKTVLPQAIH